MAEKVRSGEGDFKEIPNLSNLLTEASNGSISFCRRTVDKSFDLWLEIHMHQHGACLAMDCEIPCVRTRVLYFPLYRSLGGLLVCPTKPSTILGKGLQTAW